MGDMLHDSDGTQDKNSKGLKILYFCRMEITFASQNPDKIKEISALMPSGIKLNGLNENMFEKELPETGNTLEENALQKARFVYEKTGKPCFADDTGLEIHALNGRPGVYSARYAGEEKNADKNIRKVLDELHNSSDRKAHFRTVIAFCDGKNEHLFEGVVEGKIRSEKKGEKGFGYDPIFMPDGFSKTFAEMDLAEKNKVSHRARALTKFVEFLKNNL
jgi:XTP/dITP diphosphohydrolase